MLAHAYERQLLLLSPILKNGFQAEVPQDSKDSNSRCGAGHTSWTTSGLAYLSLFLAGKFRCFDGSGHPWKAIVSVIPTGVAVWIGITRLQVRSACKQKLNALQQFVLLCAVLCFVTSHCGASNE